MKRLFVLGSMRLANAVVMRIKDAGESRVAEDCDDLQYLPSDVDVFVAVDTDLTAQTARLLLRQRRRTGSVTVVVNDESFYSELAKFAVGEHRRVFTKSKFDSAYPPREQGQAA